MIVDLSKENTSNDQEPNVKESTGTLDECKR